MEKREDAQIYIIGHKVVDYGYWTNSLYTPIQVGFNDRFMTVRDSDDPDNISSWNNLYAEGTATYYIWKHCHPAKYKGQCQYRRRLEFTEDFNFDETFENFDVIVATPLMFIGSSVQYQYRKCHNDEDIDLAEEIIKDKYPEYAEAWVRYVKYGTFLFYSNGFVMRAEDYDNYCEWLFSIFDEFKKRREWNSIEDVESYIAKEIEEGKRPEANGQGKKEGALKYQTQVFGFLSERLFTLYIFQHYPLNRIMCRDYTKYENC